MAANITKKPTTNLKTKVGARLFEKEEPLMKNITVKKFIDSMSEQLKYVVNVTLMNGTKMNFFVSTTDFPNFEKWFTSSEPTADYLITKPNGLVRLNQKDILELTYKPLTTGNRIIKQLVYVTFKPIPQSFSIRAFIRLLMLGALSVVGWLYFKHNMTVTSVIPLMKIMVNFLIYFFSFIYGVFFFKAALELIFGIITGRDDIRQYGISIKNSNAICLNILSLGSMALVLQSILQVFTA